MPYPAYARFKYKGNVFSSPLSLCGEDNLFEILEYEHAIGGKHDTGYLFSYKWDVFHTPVRFVMNVHDILPDMYKLHAECSRNFFEEVEIFWLHYDPAKSKDEIYFKHTLYPVKVCKVRQCYPNVKSPEFEHLGHLVEIELRYRFITALFIKGYLESGKHEWQLFLTELSTVTYRLDDAAREKLLTCPTDADGIDEFVEKYKDDTKNIRLTNPCWAHTDTKKQEDTPEYAAEGDTVKLTVDINGMQEGEAVNFKILDKNSKDQQCIGFVKSTHSGGKSTAEWIVDLGTVENKDDFAIAFNAEGHTVLSSDCNIPINNNELWALIVSDDDTPAHGANFLVFKNSSAELEIVMNNKADKDGQVCLPFTNIAAHNIVFIGGDVDG
ncbi:MAG: hypothetical protein JW915_11490 [Chitinispirillaceae bacterium]|nr:hypothetical protein [Chitinispirillaceae bacterium]